MMTLALVPADGGVSRSPAVLACADSPIGSARVFAM